LRSIKYEDLMNKILFLFPNTSNRASIPTSVPILSGIAKKHGWETSYFDTTDYEKSQDSFEDKEKTGGFKIGYINNKQQRFPAEYIVDDFEYKLFAFKPDIIVITAMSCDFQYLMTFFPKINIPKNILVVIGGIHSILKPDEVIETGLFDIVCIGQGEKTFEEILINFERKYTMDNIEGTYFLYKNNGDIVRNQRRKLLDSSELWDNEPDYSMFDDRYFTYPFDGQMVNILLMEVARGCPHNCSYCGNSAIKKVYKGLGKYIVTRPLDSSFKTFNKIIHERNIDICNFVDECFLCHSKSFLKDFAANYAIDIKKPFLIQTRPETVTEENIVILNSFGASFYQISLGVESGSERILFDICNRKTKLESIIKAYDIMNKHNVRSGAYFMIGFPTETREEIFKTINLCKRINATINSVAIFQPLPGQELTELCIREGYITGNEPMQTFTGGSVLKMPQISAEEILGLSRTFLLYAKLPEDYYPLIEICERDYENNKKLYKELIELRWKYDKEYKKVKF
jgi:anaerobic magnesium-protoporphyrin IX monomethyl ester cyclase